MPVTEYLLEKMQFTIYITGVATVISIPIGILLGVLSATIKNKFGNIVLQVVFFGLGSVPVFVWAYFLQYWLCWKLGIFPYLFPSGYDFLSPGMIKAAICPILALSFNPIASYMYLLRNSVLESMTQDYVLLLKVKGLSQKQIIRKHVFRNAIITLFPEIYANLIFVSTSSFLIERIFAIPGASYTFIRSFFAADRDRHSEYLRTGYLGVTPDYAVFMILAMFYVAIAIIGGILLDITYGLVDPRIRVSTNKMGE